MKPFPEARRRFAVPLIVAAVALVLAVVSWHPLVGWFTGQSTGAPEGPGVQQKAGPFQVTARIDPDPPSQRGNTLWLTVADAQGKPVTGARVEVQYRMPAMGAMPEMRGNAEVSEAGGGTYRARYDLPMEGGWTLHTEIAAGGRTGIAEYAITVGSAGITAKGGEGQAMGAMPDMPGMKMAPLPAGFVRSVKAAQDVYEQLRGALAADRLQEAKATARVLGQGLSAAQQQGSGVPAMISDQLKAAIGEAKAIAAASALGPARTAFGKLSDAMIALAAHDPALQQGWHVFECPMVPGKPRWMQAGDRVSNPYLGSRMPTCGTPVGLAPKPAPAAASGAVKVTPQEREALGLRTAPVTRKPLALTLHALGQVKVDETRQVDVTLRVKGWIHDLKVDATGQPVRKGQVMFTLYSPELFSAEQEYLLALHTRSADIARELVRASEEKLRLWGLSQAQIAAIAKRGKPIENLPFLAPASGYVLEKNVVEGAEVEPGQKLYRIAPLEKVWVDAQVYEGDLPYVRVGEPATVTLSYAPGKTFEGKVTYVYPTLQGATRTGTVRVELRNPDLVLKPEMYADVLLKRDLGEALQVPAAAVLYTGPRRIVFVDRGNGELVPKDVTLGARAGDAYQVLSGLSPGDRVVTQGQFLIAAESRLKSATGFWAEAK